MIPANNDPKYKEFKGDGNEFWTSGSNEGVMCDKQNVYNWCSPSNNDSVFLPEFLTQTENKFFLNIKAADPGKDRCVTLKMNLTSSDKIGFEHAPCNKTLRYICEVTLNI
jgi:hypothetical protein